MCRENAIFANSLQKSEEKLEKDAILADSLQKFEEKLLKEAQILNLERELLRIEVFSPILAVF